MIGRNMYLGIFICTVSVNCWSDAFLQLPSFVLVLLCVRVARGAEAWSPLSCLQWCPRGDITHVVATKHEKPHHLSGCFIPRPWGSDFQPFHLGVAPAIIFFLFYGTPLYSILIYACLFKHSNPRSPNRYQVQDVNWGVVTSMYVLIAFVTCCWEGIMNYQLR